MKGSRKRWSDYLASSSVQPALFDPPDQPKRRKSGSVRKVVPREVDIQKVILDALRMHPMVARIERTNTGAGRLLGPNGAGRFVRFGFPGQADLTGTSTDGKTIAIEVKRPTTRSSVTDEQRRYLQTVRDAGGLAGVATCYEEAAAIVEGRF